jgi:hypothetical protein
MTRIKACKVFATLLGCAAILQNHAFCVQPKPIDVGATIINPPFPDQPEAVRRAGFAAAVPHPDSHGGLVAIMSAGVIAKFADDELGPLTKIITPMACPMAPELEFSSPVTPARR